MRQFTPYCFFGSQIYICKYACFVSGNSGRNGCDGGWSHEAYNDILGQGGIAREGDYGYTATVLLQQHIFVIQIAFVYYIYIYIYIYTNYTSFVL